jgi:hypothetical protein
LGLQFNGRTSKYQGEQGMGEAKQKRSATAKLIAEYPDCCFCGGQRRATTREHMPPKALFDNSHRPDKLVMPACEVCNRGTSNSDQTASVISRWELVPTEQQRKDHRRLVNGLRTSMPELIAEWTAPNPSNALATRKYLAKHGVAVPPDARMATVGPITIRLINLFAHKVALGLYFEHFRKPLPNTGRVCAIWRTKEDHAGRQLPPAPLAMMDRYATLAQGVWNTSEVFEYRYQYDESAGLFICLANIRSGNMLIWGFAVVDGDAMPAEEAKDWMRPVDVLSLQNDPNPKRQ